MKLFLLTQRQRKGYDTYDSCVVSAKTDSDAKNIHPNTTSSNPWKTQSWADSVEHVVAIYIGEARKGMPSQIVCSSFNAG